MSNGRPWAKLMATLAACVAWWALLSFSLPIGETGAPPLGKFLNPLEGFYRNNALEYYTEDDLHLPGLRAPVEVVYDNRLVPHIYASTPGDLYYAQGYIQAQHRLFQLDLTSRSADGRLSEVVGPSTLELDRTRKRIGASVAADAIDSMWRQDVDSYAQVQRYADGVNAYIATLQPHDYPIEYKLLGFSPEAWSPRKTALVALSMAFTLNAHHEDVAATRTRELLGEDRFAELFPDRSPNDEPIIPRGTEFLRGDTALLRSADQYRLEDTRLPTLGLSLPSGANGYMPSPEGIGSNNWAIAPHRTANGYALLANDPHLSLTLPSIWFESELHTGGLHVHGVNLPGVPGVTIGFNEQAAWGVTNVGVDVLDWHALDFEDAGHTRYRTADGSVATVTHRPIRIKVKGEADVLDTVAVTEFGPIVYTSPDDYRQGLAMDWLTVREPSAQTIEAFLGLNRAHSLTDFVSAAQQLEWPAQNIVFANRTGDIALRVSGKFPRRLPGQGKFILTASDPRSSGTLAPSQNPLAVNPEQGYLASTNQVSTDNSYPYYYLGNFEHTRSRRINELLSTGTAFTPAQMKEYQLDDHYVTAADLTPSLLSLIDRKGLGQSSLGQLALLESWDYHYKADAVAAVIFEEWMDAIAQLTWDELDTADGGPILQPDRWLLSQLLKQDPLSPYFDIEATTEREVAKDIVNRAFRDITDQVAAIDNNGDRPAWAQYNDPHVSHIARIAPFGRSDLSSGGRAGTLNAQRGDVGPSWRMVVELSPQPSAMVVYPGGQSGRPGHPHYDDFVDEWADGRYFETTLLSKADDHAEADVKHQFMLQPGAE